MINDGRYPDYPLFKGLQRPLELMGLQGRYIYWAAGVAGGAIVGFIAAYCLMGFVAGLVVLATVLSAGIVLIILKQRKGHHFNCCRGDAELVEHPFAVFRLSGHPLQGFV